MYGRDTPVGYQKSISTGRLRPREKRLRALRVERVLHDVRLVPQQARWHELMRHHAAAGVERADDARAIEPVRDRLADVELVHRRYS